MMYFLYRLGRILVLGLSLDTCYRVAVVLADVFHFFSVKDRRNLEFNLRIALGTDDRRLLRRYIRGILRNFAKYLVDFFRFSKLTGSYLMSNIKIEGKENLDKALARGKGAILLAAHIGNWELGGAIVASLGYPLYAIALDHKDKRVNDFFIEQRAFADVKIIRIGAQLRTCYQVLRENKLLAILGDRDFSGHGIKVNYFGRPAILPRGPAVFHLRTGAPIIPTFPIRVDGNRFRLVFEEPIECTKTDNRESNIENLIEKYISVVEKYIKAFPDQWYAFQKVWQP